MKLYHGSNMEIEKIDLSCSKPNKDFGRAFYLSDVYEQAVEMARFKSVFLGGKEVVTTYEIDETIFMDKTFKPNVGLKMGTIFPELVSPYIPCQSIRVNEFLEATNKVGEGCNKC